eukprot:TRINITY_DN4053_c0_g1_i1.p1 TRINITY_DN4053_c0_g1~~TRINITY_DN4053_c0_g1_i1.p1  ORF type:complete len:820 (+),score=135.07 TRINITY_DN4053_c0_g1_i1:265-2724(+)
MIVFILFVLGSGNTDAGCESFGEEECLISSTCRWHSQMSKCFSECSAYSDASSCRNSKCFWWRESCFLDESNCDANPANYCYGSCGLQIGTTSCASCDLATNITSCMLLSGCEWNGTVCGSPSLNTPCNQLDESSCISMDECFWGLGSCNPPSQAAVPWCGIQTDATTKCIDWRTSLPAQCDGLNKSDCVWRADCEWHRSNKCAATDRCNSIPWANNCGEYPGCWMSSDQSCTTQAITCKNLDEEQCGSNSLCVWESSTCLLYAGCRGLKTESSCLSRNCVYDDAQTCEYNTSTVCSSLEFSCGGKECVGISPVLNISKLKVIGGSLSNGATVSDLFESSFVTDSDHISMGLQLCDAGYVVNTTNFVVCSTGGSTGSFFSDFCVVPEATSQPLPTEAPLPLSDCELFNELQCLQAGSDCRWYPTIASCYPPCGTYRDQGSCIASLCTYRDSGCLLESVSCSSMPSGSCSGHCGLQSGTTNCISCDSALSLSQCMSISGCVWNGYYCNESSTTTTPTPQWCGIGNNLTTECIDWSFSDCSGLEAAECYWKADCSWHRSNICASVDRCTNLPDGSCDQFPGCSLSSSSECTSQAAGCKNLNKDQCSVVDSCVWDGGTCLLFAGCRTLKTESSCTAMGCAFTNWGCSHQQTSTTCSLLSLVCEGSVCDGLASNISQYQIIGSFNEGMMAADADNYLSVMRKDNQYCVNCELCQPGFVINKTVSVTCSGSGNGSFGGQICIRPVVLMSEAGGGAGANFLVVVIVSVAVIAMVVMIAKIVRKVNKCEQNDDDFQDDDPATDYTATLCDNPSEESVQELRELSPE